jgi:hypothetical protein
MKTIYRICIAAPVVCAALLCAPSAANAQSDYFQQDVEYVIQVKLDTEAKISSGRETIRYVNNSPDTLRQFYLHLYPNAFRDKTSDYMKFRNRRYNATFGNIPKGNRSWMNLQDVTVDGDTVGVEVDDTIARFDLPQPLLPGGAIELRLRFESKVRKRYGRAGYVGDHYDFAQWYPKVVVYDENGFHPDKHKAGEFYGEFGTFDVSLELPSHFVVAATGTLAEGDPGWDYNAPGGGSSAPPDDGSNKIVRFRAENVHDFAWCANPEFVVQDTTVDGVTARVYYRKRNAGRWEDRVLDYTVRALDFLSRKVGAYGYPQVSVVDVPSSYGMEYPMLVMNGRASEGLVLHELAHIYFYGMLGNDERAEPWLDEGFATFMTTWYMEERYGKYGNTARWNWYRKITPQYKLWENLRRNVIDLQRRGYGERTAKRAEDYDNSYRAHVYQKAALFINAIRFLTGDDEFETILRNYYDTWQYKHVNEERFRGACERWAGVDLSRGFEQWLHTTKVCDYKLAEIKTTPRADGGVDAAVRIERIGELYIPFDLIFQFENGDTVTHRIDSRLRTIKESFRLPSKPKRTAINPFNEILDVNLRDNFSPRQRDIQIDWPNNDYYPEWGYQFRHRLGAWYNDVDGLKAGYVVRGSYLGEVPRWRAGVYYGFLSERVDFDVRYEHGFELFGNSGLAYLQGWKMEGREDVTAYIKATRRPKLIEPPTHELVIGFNWHELTDPRYLTRPNWYDTNKVDLGPYFVYSVYPEFDWFSTRVDADLKLGRKWWKGEYKYERFTTTAALYSRSRFLDFRWRLFLGLLGGSIPRQQRFQIGEAGPLQQEQNFWLRSPGAVWDWLHYHKGGDGNIRGYSFGTVGVNRLFSTNVELGTPLPLWYLEKITKPLVGPIHWYAFYDVGWIMDKENPDPDYSRLTELVDSGLLDWTLQDAGIGLRSRRLFPFYDLTLRFDMPIWVNHPVINGEEEETKFRYLFSIQGSF